MPDKELFAKDDGGNSVVSRLNAELRCNADKADWNPVTDSSVTYGDLRKIDRAIQSLREQGECSKHGGVNQYCSICLAECAEKIALSARAEPAPATETAREWPQDVRNVTLDPQILIEARKYFEITARSEKQLPEWLAYFAEKIAVAYHAAQSAAGLSNTELANKELRRQNHDLEAGMNAAHANNEALRAERDEALRKVKEGQVLADEKCRCFLVRAEAAERQVAELRERLGEKA